MPAETAITTIVFANARTARKCKLIISIVRFSFKNSIKNSIRFRLSLTGKLDLANIVAQGIIDRAFDRIAIWTPHKVGFDA
jgi:hypothetical protein